MSNHLKVVPREHADLMRELQVWMQEDFKSPKTIDRAVRSFTKLIDNTREGIPKDVQYIKTYVFNMLAHLKNCLLTKFGDAPTLYDCLHAAKERRDFFTDKQRDTLKFGLTEAERIHGKWIRNKSSPPSLQYSSSNSNSNSSSTYDFPSSSKIHTPPSHKPNSAPSSPKYDGHRIPSPPPPPPSPPSPPPRSPSNTISNYDSSYDYVTKSDHESETKPDHKRRHDYDDSGGYYKFSKQEYDKNESDSAMSQSQVSDTVQQARRALESAKDVATSCITKIKSISTRMETEREWYINELESVRSKQQSVQSLVEHLESKFCEVEKSVRHLEDKSSESENILQAWSKDRERLNDLELQVKRLTEKMGSEEPSVITKSQDKAEYYSFL